MGKDKGEDSLQLEQKCCISEEKVLPKTLLSMTEEAGAQGGERFLKARSLLDVCTWHH